MRTEPEASKWNLLAEGLAIAAILATGAWLRFRDLDHAQFNGDAGMVVELPSSVSVKGMTVTLDRVVDPARTTAWNASNSFLAA